jgi:predicted DNA-binding protein
MLRHTPRMTATKTHRINARLPPEVAQKVAYLERRMNMSTTEVVRESIERYYAALTEENGASAQALERAGFIGCASGPTDLSISYKAELGRSIGKKT